MCNLEHWCYESLFYLYAGYERKYIDKGYAEKRKHDIETEYGHGCVLMRMFKECCERERRLRGLCLEIQQNGTEREKRLLRILDGSERAFESKV